MRVFIHVIFKKISPNINEIGLDSIITNTNKTNATTNKIG